MRVFDWSKGAAILQKVQRWLYLLHAWCQHHSLLLLHHPNLFFPLLEFKTDLERSTHTFFSYFIINFWIFKSSPSLYVSVFILSGTPQSTKLFNPPKFCSFNSQWQWGLSRRKTYLLTSNKNVSNSHCHLHSFVLPDLHLLLTSFPDWECHPHPYQPTPQPWSCDSRSSKVKENSTLCKALYYRFSHLG